MDISQLPARERILVTAHDLFYRDGIRATGVDRIIAQSGVAKLTFYRHFLSKDDLIIAFLDYRHTRWMAWFVDALGRHGATPGGGLFPLVGALGEWFADPAFRGCAFINTVAELGDSLPRARALAYCHKREMIDVIAALIPPGQQQGGAAHAAAMTIDGAIMQAQIAGGTAVLPHLKRVLCSLVLD